MRNTVLALVSIALLSACGGSSDRESQSAETSGSIAGGIWLEEETLRGATLYLCPVKEQYQFKRLTQARPSSDVAVSFFEIDLDRMNRTAEQVCPEQVAADIEGKYQFEAVDPGDYLLYAAHKGDRDLAFWSLPVSVGGEAIALDLNEGNASDRLAR